MKEQEEIKTRFIFPYKIFLWEAFLFSLTLGLGIFSAYRLNKFLEIQKISPPQISFWQFIFYFIVATLFIFFASRFLKFKRGKGILYKVIFIFTVAWAGLISLSALMPNILALILMIILIFWWLKKPTILIHNIIVVLGIAGMGALLGLQLAPLVVVALLLILSVYDFIAVCKTKHMVKMAKDMLEHRVILALIVPKKNSDFGEEIKEVKAGGKFLILGSGDVAFPLLLCVSLIPADILSSVIVAVFALIGLFASFWIFVSQKIRQPIPALPPIALFSILGYSLTLIIR